MLPAPNQFNINNPIDEEKKVCNKVLCRAEKPCELLYDDVEDSRYKACSTLYIKFNLVCSAVKHSATPFEFSLYSRNKHLGSSWKHGVKID